MERPRKKLDKECKKHGTPTLPFFMTAIIFMFFYAPLSRPVAHLYAYNIRVIYRTTTHAGGISMFVYSHNRIAAAFEMAIGNFYRLDFSVSGFNLLFYGSLLPGLPDAVFRAMHQGSLRPTSFFHLHSPKRISAMPHSSSSASLSRTRFAAAYISAVRAAVTRFFSNR